MTAVREESKATAPPTSADLGILGKVICPHCWHRFVPGDVVWVSQHDALVGDPIAGPDAAKRFLPSRFTPDCQAIDPCGMPCQQIACPHCHLILPKSLIRAEAMLLSIIGGPSSGKTWFLTSMIWQLRRVLPKHFSLLFNDADPLSNVMLNENEAKLFLSETPDDVVTLMKTEERAGGFYDQVTIAGQPIELPKPFLFDFKPTNTHALAGSPSASRVLCLYDNAGESFQPGRDTSLNPSTRHLAKAKAIMFLFDPTQDPRFREKCRPFSQDPQVRARSKFQTKAGDSAMSQHTLLLEATQRVRRYTGLAQNKKYERPMMVLVSKSDVWGPLLEGEDLTTEPFLQTEEKGDARMLDLPRVERVSGLLRGLLMQWTPEVVSAAEGLCERVVYIPVSSLGTGTEPMPENPGFWGARPRNIQPRWVTVPMLYLFARWAAGVIPAKTRGI